MISMSRSSQDNFRGKISQKSIKYSQSYNVLCQWALLGSEELLNKYSDGRHVLFSLADLA